MQKRRYAANGYAAKAKRPTLKALVRASKALTVVPGFTRREGFYGRFGPGRPEAKFLDTTLSFSFDATAEVPATGTSMVIVPQGDEQSQRVGRKIIVQSIEIHGVVELVPGASATANDIVFFYVILDTQCNGANPAASGNAGVFTSATLNEAHLNLANEGRFVILKRWVVVLNPGSGATTAYNNTKRALWWKKNLNVPIMYDASATTGALTTIRSNNIFFVTGSGSDDLSSFNGTCRIRFMDS